MGLYPQSGGPALAMLDSRVEILVRGPIVEAVVVQRFRNTGDRATEATYIFPLPADAAVSGLAIQIGSRTIRAAIETREAAQRRYEAAVTAGVAGALLEQERPDVFTQNVSAIPPGGVVAVTLRYDAVARHAAGGWELVVPMVVAPRYVRSGHRSCARRLAHHAGGGAWRGRGNRDRDPLRRSAGRGRQSDAPGCGGAR
jgi:Ca-activated chloride channel family protein